MQGNKALLKEAPEGWLPWPSPREDRADGHLRTRKQVLTPSIHGHLILPAWGAAER